MYEHEAESDEDCDVYFLKPVNEYNIVDKIKEANKELFAAIMEPECDENAEQALRKVTFALNLEDYEPMEKAQQNDEMKLKGIEIQRTTISEEPILEETAEQAEQIDQSEKAGELTIVGQIEIDEIIDETERLKLTMPTAATLNEAKTTENQEIEEEDICEDIVIMDIENEKIQTEHIMVQSMLRKMTFDYDEQDNKSLTNLLPASDCEYEAVDQKQENAENIKMDNDSDDDNDEQHGLNNTFTYNTAEDDDEDDHLSIIVASYLPNDFELLRKQYLSNKSNSSNNNSSSSSSSGNSSNIQTSTVKSRTKTFFNSKNLPFRCKSQPSIAAANANASMTQHRETMNELKFNYKTCCEYRNSLQEKLPKYTGYLSEYGLSLEQLIERENQLKRKQHFMLEQTLRANEEELQKMHDNERAFTTWLKNKMRYPINKTRNMFDVKIRRGIVAAGTVSRACSGVGGSNSIWGMGKIRFK